MVSSGIAIQIVGENEGVERMLDALDTALNPLAIAGFLNLVVEPYLRGRATDRFRSEGDDVTGAWQPLKPATVEIRGSAHPINHRSGELEAYITGSPSGGGVQAWGASLIMPGEPPSGELLLKVKTAQEGREYPSTVARPVLGMNEQDLVFVLSSMAFYIESVGKDIL